MRKPCVTVWGRDLLKAICLCVPMAGVIASSVSANEIVLNRYIVWLEPSISDEAFKSTLDALDAFEPLAPSNRQSFRSFVQVQNILPAFRAVVVDMPPQIADALNANLDKIPNLAFVGKDFTVESFDSELCPGSPGSLPAAKTPPGVCRVGGGGASDFAGANVWIIDSGVDNASGLLNIDQTNQADCRGGGACTVGAGANVTDTNG